MIKTHTRLLLLVLLTSFSSNLFSQDWALKQAPLMTKWAAQVDPKNPLPEYPRPQMVRKDWMNLNGIWQFQPGVSGDVAPVGKDLQESILVPYPVESAISGVMKHHERIWYRRTFTIPSQWKGQRIMLNFGAVDWESEVFVNGKSVGVHRGGYDPFSYDITPFLSGKGRQELIVRVFDPSENGGQPRGKQAIRGIEIMYTPSTGIWQTVWLEPVPKAGISDIKITPDIAISSVKLTVNTLGSVKDVSVAVQIKTADKVVQSAVGSPNTEITIPIPDARLWSPDDPFLYDLSISLVQNKKTADHISSYFGMRKISVGMVDGVQRILLNNKFVFQLGALDQGFWPDGIYTAPTDEALRYDLEQQKALGFNMIRKHVKVEPYRWYYWADKLGFLVWQDMPTAQSYGGVDADARQYSAELTRMVQTHWNIPSIIMWVVYNEKCGQDVINKTIPTPVLTNMVKELDPSRLVNEASGYDWYGSGDIADSHTYPAPKSIPGKPNQAIVSGEYGATKYPLEGHLWGKDNVVEVTSEDEYINRYENYANALCYLKTKGLNGAVYTQITDVETELNGIITYDRAAFKTDINKLRTFNLNAINKELSLEDVLPNSQNQGQSWKYITAAPAASWYKASFNDSGWSNSKGPFASAGTPDINIGTSWTSSDIWLRKQFRMGDLNTEDLNNLVFNLYHDDDCEIYLNGILAASIKGFSTYSIIPFNEVAKKALILNGTNTIAVHCHQDAGGQGIDVGIAKKIIR
ncbi:glycoside hydrolase family 2 protein [Arcticibacter tournemirensis]|uniref:Glycoside hydrolase family 2 n=1 Tax=Arcticibacter tournemirensis TaxID=699437 RepID=A0A4Q0MFW2_9SPHI|nr:sugar-binding domain-containing protein [Arcticibacter tournemirensis]RXF72387.1 glycoside hydrolase family 2 [Arcticibacter tournemirensis]